MNQSNPINLGPLTLDIRPREKIIIIIPKKFPKSHISCIKFDTNFIIPKTQRNTYLCVCVSVFQGTNKIVYENVPIITTKHEKNIHLN